MESNNHFRVYPGFGSPKQIQLLEKEVEIIASNFPSKKRGRHQYENDQNEHINRAPKSTQKSQLVILQEPVFIDLKSISKPSPITKIDQVSDIDPFVELASFIFSKKNSRSLKHH